MTLQEWIKETGRRQNWVAKQLGVKDETLSRWVNGKTRPRTATQKLVERFTDGAVVVGVDWPSTSP